MSSSFGENWKRAVEQAEERRPWTPRRAAYVDYMQSDAWRRRRAEKLLLNIMEYGVLTCEVCWTLIDVDRGQVAAVHHHTYVRFMEEQPGDLAVVHKGECHNKIDEQRAARTRWEMKLLQQAPRVHPDQLQLFDYFTPTMMEIEDVVADAPAPDSSA